MTKFLDVYCNKNSIRNVLDRVKLHLEAQLDGNVCELRLDVFLAFRQKTIIRNDCQAVFGLP